MAETTPLTLGRKCEPERWRPPSPRLVLVRYYSILYNTTMSWDLVNFNGYPFQLLGDSLLQCLTWMGAVSDVDERSRRAKPQAVCIGGGRGVGSRVSPSIV